MALSRKLREAVCEKLNIKSAQLYNRISAKAIDAGTADRDVALLLLAHEAKIDVVKPRFDVPKGKLDELKEHLKAQKTPIQVPLQVPSNTKRYSKSGSVQFRRLLKFKGKYPEIFYDRLEDEINTAYSNPNLPNAVLILSRKLIENLVYNLVEYKFDGPRIDLYYDTAHRRAHDFSVLLQNLKDHKSDFDADQHELIDKFMELAGPFRRDANSTAHKVIEYLESMSEVKRLKIEMMTQILLKLIDRVKK